MKGIGRNKRKTAVSTSRLATNIPTIPVTFHTDTTPKFEQRYIANPGLPQSQPIILDDPTPEEPPLPFLDAPDEDTCAMPAYETTPACDEKGNEKGAKIRQSVAHMNELRAEEAVFLQILLSLHHHSQLLTPCACGKQLRSVACTECLQTELLCPQCWLNKHRTLPTHWAFIWNSDELFFKKNDFCRVMKNAVIGIGHHSERCPDADMGRSFTLADSNGIHATCIAFCRCKTPNGKRGEPEFQQLLRAGIFPGSVSEPKTGYTLGLLDYHDIYANFLAITRFYENLRIIMERGQAHGLDVPLPGEAERPYPNRPKDFLGVPCAACPERGVNMPFFVDIPSYLRHLISQNLTLDGNWKANLFVKRDNGSDISLTDGKMYFPNQTAFEEFAKTYVVPVEDKEIPCKAHIDSIRHQGHAKYGNTAVSGVVACACDHSVLGSLVDMIKGEAFALGTYAQREQLRHTNSPPHGPETASPINFSYDSWCSFVVNLVKRALELFPDEVWLHELLAGAEGQIPADHINGHGIDCQAIWQAVYFACRAHFHGETAEMIWAFLNPLGSSTRQMTGAARHDIINFVMQAWNTLKVLRAGELLAAERLDALRLFELHMAVVEDLSRQHATDVPAWSQMSRKTTKSADGKPKSVYQHETTKVLTMESVLATMIAVEQEKLKQNNGYDAGTPMAQWIHDGMSIERSQSLTIALLRNHREHPLEDTWASIIKLRDTLNVDLKKFRERQREIFPRLKLSALDVDEPELTPIQLPSSRMKLRQRPTLTPTIPADGDDQDSQAREVEIKLRCAEAESGILAVRAASLALSAVKKARDQDYRGQAGVTRSQRNLQKAELMKTFEITMYNNARTALIHLGHMEKDADEPYRLLSHRDTRRKETHLHRAKGDSRLFNGTAWYLQSGVTISGAAVALSRGREQHSDDDEPQLLAGTQTLKRSGGFKHNQRSPKHLKDIAPEDVDVLSAPSSDAEDNDLEKAPSKPGRQKGEKKGKSKQTKRDGWIWMESLMRGQATGDEKLARTRRKVIGCSGFVRKRRCIAG
ncbi:hypothetical protein B0H13DRAFT_2389291 [Mycena leptocephala]|nr:hypothetical protein B0H13DRAFT_2389291 [Mycena leptocephala]